MYIYTGETAPNAFRGKFISCKQPAIVGYFVVYINIHTHTPTPMYIFIHIHIHTLTPICIFLNFTCVCAYIGETAPNDLRGKLVALMEAALSCTLLYSYSYMCMHI